MDFQVKMAIIQLIISNIAFQYHVVHFLMSGLNWTLIMGSKNQLNIDYYSIIFDTRTTFELIPNAYTPEQ